MQTPIPEAAQSPRAAASLLVVRMAGGTPELLMARRGAGHRFMPNVLVFPGGAVDAEDYRAAVASPLRPGVLARLQRSADAGLAQALGVAAARELTEEVGLSLGTPPALDGLDYLCRAVTPPDRSIRFDARFFVVDAARVTGTLAGSAELEEPGWYTVATALQADIALATRAVLGCFAQSGGQMLRDGLVPVLRDRAWGLE